MCSFFILAWKKKHFSFTVVQFEASHPLVMYELSHERPRFVTLSSHILLKPWVLAGLVALFFLFLPHFISFSITVWPLIFGPKHLSRVRRGLNSPFRLCTGSLSLLHSICPPSPRGLGMGWGEGALTPHFHSNRSSTFCNLCDFNP